MTEQALPCVVCGIYLRNVWDEAENQPKDGLAFSSRGHYGSTVFDPMDGTFIELNICDKCLIEAGERGRVLSGRRMRPVAFENLEIGWEEVETPLVEWNKDVAAYGDIAELYVEDLDEPLPKTFHIDPNALEAARKLIVRDGEW
jgi:hypothetical protein